MNLEEHWNQMYQQVPSELQGWYEVDPTFGLSLIEKYTSSTPTSTLIAGGGTTTLLPALIKTMDLHPLHFVDISSRAIEKSQENLGREKEKVIWKQADLFQPFMLDEKVNIWFDRAVFNFAIDEEKRTQYLENINNALAEKGILILGVF